MTTRYRTAYVADAEPPTFREGDALLRPLLIVLAIVLATARWPLTASAESHFPIVDIVPTSSFTTTSDGIDPHGGPKTPAPTNGDTEINGTVTVPVIDRFTLSFDRLSLGTYDDALSAVAIPGVGRIFPGGGRDLIRVYRGDYATHGFTFEGGFAERYRRCCPADSFEWHKGYASLSYSYLLRKLGGTVVAAGVTLNANHQNLSPDSLAALPVGLAVPNGPRIFTTQQFANIAIPVGGPTGIRVSGTFIWGALNDFNNEPFPWYYDVWAFELSKQVTPYFAFTVHAENDEQRIQGSPFPPPNAIRNADLSLLGDFHFDFNKIVNGMGARAPRPIQPKTPGGPAGPVTPSTSSSPAPQ